MGLTRKHFNELAKIVKQHDSLWPEYGCPHIQHLAIAIADLCDDENPHFKREYFYEACGLSKAKVSQKMMEQDSG